MGEHFDWFADLDVDELVSHPNQRASTPAIRASFAEFMRCRARAGNCGRCIGGPLDGQERCTTLSREETQLLLPCHSSALQ